MFLFDFARSDPVCKECKVNPVDGDDSMCTTCRRTLQMSFLNRRRVKLRRRSEVSCAPPPHAALASSYSPEERRLDAIIKLASSSISSELTESSELTPSTVIRSQRVVTESSELTPSTVIRSQRVITESSELTPSTVIRSQKVVTESSELTPSTVIRLESVKRTEASAAPEILPGSEAAVLDRFPKDVAVDDVSQWEDVAVDDVSQPEEVGVDDVSQPEEVGVDDVSQWETSEHPLARNTDFQTKNASSGAVFTFERLTAGQMTPRTQLQAQMSLGVDNSLALECVKTLDCAAVHLPTGNFGTLPSMLLVSPAGSCGLCSEKVNRWLLPDVFSEMEFQEWSLCLECQKSMFPSAHRALKTLKAPRGARVRLSDGMPFCEFLLSSPVPVKCLSLLVWPSALHLLTSLAFPHPVVQERLRWCASLRELELAVAAFLPLKRPDWESHVDGLTAQVLEKRSEQHPLFCPMMDYWDRTPAVDIQEPSQVEVTLGIDPEIVRSYIQRLWSRRVHKS
ncbi:MAG: uncharacterized protein KVP18_003589 [Porospora cf. gigantea A]|uniref:uncharacterized protein n=1 Tax=Porospora cf. gigantea A TaxID=2853593 RepID=UPI0035598534|nr:MAG: hypothetical protein KVP18_003589 [Porospora cf. gigantea A]